MSYKMREADMRIGINIPDDLDRRLGPFKSSINVSQLCKDAIAEYVSLRERAQEEAESDKVDKLASRLFEERKKTRVDWELFGLQDARAWASSASGDEWDTLLDRIDCHEAQGKSPFDARIPIPRVKGVKNYYDRQYEIDVDNGWFELHINDEANPYVVAQSQYQRGFLAYVMIVRRKLRERLTADLKAQDEQSRQMKSELRSNVEIPKRLKH
jgi:hypothetical protein